MSDVCKLSEVKATPEAKKAGIACVEKSLNGAALVDSLKAMKVNVDMAVKEGWINNRYSGYPALAQAIAKLGVVDGFVEFKIPFDGQVPIENIADSFSKSLGKDGIADITADEYKGNYQKLREAILYRWKEKHADHLKKNIKSFKDIVSATRTNTSDEVDLEQYK